MLLFYVDVFTDILTVNEYYLLPAPVSFAVTLTSILAERIFSFFVVYQSFRIKNRHLENFF